MATALEEFGLPVPPGNMPHGNLAPMPKPSHTAPHPDSDVAKGTMPHPGAGPSHAEFMANTYIPGPKEKSDADEQLRQTEEILNKKVGDETARKSLAPLIDVGRVINGIDISPVLPFTGFEGRMRYHYEQAKNAINANTGLNLHVSPEFQLAQTFHDNQAKGIADAVRQALATSIRSEYVKHMVMPLVSPDIWKNSPETAVMKFNFLKNWLNDRARLYTLMANKGIPVNQEELEKYMTVNVPKAEIPTKEEMAKIQARQPSRQQGLYSSALGKPVSEQDIQDTMKAQGLSRDQVMTKYGIK